MVRFVPGKRYMAKDQWGKPTGKIYLCTGRTDSFVYFEKNAWGEEYRRKPHTESGTEYVDFDKGEGSRIRGVKIFVVRISAQDHV